MTDALSAAIESILRTDDLSEEIHQAQINTLRDAYDAALAEPVLQTCNCRWDGETQVQQCTLHEAHVDAIHEWAERAKTAEKKLAALKEPVQETQRKPLTEEEIWALIHPIVMADMPDEMTDYEIARAVEQAHGIK